MEINKKLNLVIKCDGYFIHSTPISFDIYAAYSEILNHVFAAIADQGRSRFLGPKISYATLKRLAKEMGVSEEVEKNLVGEIIRLSNAIVPADGGGWQTIPLDVAVRNGIINDETFFNIKNQQVFFTCNSWILEEPLRTGIMSAANELWGSQLTLSNSTEYAASLPILTQDENIGERANQSFIPH